MHENLVPSIIVLTFPIMAKFKDKQDKKEPISSFAKRLIKDNSLL